MTLQQFRIVKVAVGYALGIVASVITLIAAFSQPEWHWIYVLTVLFGGATGWCAGILLSPKSKSEESRYSSFRAGIATFLGGFVAGKVDRLFDSLFSGGGGPTDVLVLGLLLFGIAFELGMLFTFIGREADPILSAMTRANEPKPLSEREKGAKDPENVSATVHSKTSA